MTKFKKDPKTQRFVLKNQLVFENGRYKDLNLQKSKNSARSILSRQSTTSAKSVKVSQEKGGPIKPHVRLRQLVRQADRVPKEAKPEVRHEPREKVSLSKTMRSNSGILC